MAAYPILQLKLCVDKSRDINPSREHWPEMEQLTDNLLKLLHNKRMEVEIFQERKLTSILGASLLNDYISCGDDPARKVPYVPGSGTISILSKVVCQPSNPLALDSCSQKLILIFRPSEV